MAGSSGRLLVSHDGEDGALARLRETNRRRVVAHLGRHGPTSRADLARATGLSRTTVSAIVAGLVAEGRVRESDLTSAPYKGGSGRRPRPVALCPPDGLVAGIDLGHRHVRVRVADRAGIVLGEARRVVDVDAAGAVVLDLAASLVRRLVQELGSGALVQAAACLPAPVDARTGCVDEEVLPRWRGRRPAEDLAHLLGVATTVDNDANLGALAEAQTGAGRSARDLVYLKLSSGLGSGLLLEGRLHRGRQGRAGEIGHVRVAGGAARCRCGALGCLETVVAGQRLVERVNARRDRPVDLAGLVRLDRAGDDVVREVLTEAGEVLGRAVAVLARCLDPDLVVVGGSLGQTVSVRRGLTASLAVAYLGDGTEGAPPRVVRAELGEDAEITGATALALAAGARG